MEILPAWIQQRPERFIFILYSSNQLCAMVLIWFFKNKTIIDNLQD